MRRTLLIALAVVAVLLVASQILLPRLAENRLRDELAATGAVQEVDVEAFPALGLLLGRADSVRVRLGSVQTGSSRLGEWLGRADDVDRLDVRADAARVGPLEVSDAVLRKDGDAIGATAVASRAAIQAAMPGGVGVEVKGAEGGALQLEVMAGPVGVDAQAAARDGALVVAADGLLGALATFTVFEHPALRVTGIDAQPQGDGFRFAVRGVTADPA